jgi:hypothetical protein
VSSGFICRNVVHKNSVQSSLVVIDTVEENGTMSFDALFRCEPCKKDLDDVKEKTDECEPEGAKKCHCHVPKQERAWGRSQKFYSMPRQRCTVRSIVVQGNLDKKSTRNENTFYIRSSGRN